MAESALPDGFRAGKTRDANARAPKSTRSRFMMTASERSNCDQHVRKGQRGGCGSSYSDKHGGRRRVAAVVRATIQRPKRLSRKRMISSSWSSTGLLQIILN